ncbi:MAG: C2 domain-containing protein, partial [Methylococcaceae bacterium]
LYVWEDRNKNKQIDNSDRYLFAVSSGKKSIKISDKGTQYLARVYGKAGGYAISAITKKTVKLNVISAKNYGKFDGGRNNKPDFYVKTQIYRSKRHQSKTIGNNDNPVFNHRHQETYSPKNGLVPLSIDLYDSDRFSKDDQADIHPSPKFKRLDLVYDLYHKQIKTNDGRVLGKPGQAITVKGDRPGNSQASVTFVVR